LCQTLLEACIVGAENEDAHPTKAKLVEVRVDDSVGIRDQNETADRHAASEKLMTTVRWARRRHVLEQFRELATESARVCSGGGGGLRRGYAVLHE
jgi:hypothetical protein